MNSNLHLVQLSQLDRNGDPLTIYAIALRIDGTWFWYPDPKVTLGDEQRVVRWVRIDDIKDWNYE